MTKLINERSGTLYTRAIAIVIQNPLNGVPSVRFNEEDVVVEPTGDQRATGFSGDYVQAAMTDPTESFVTINPLDGEPLGGASNVTEMQVLLTSYYYYLKEKQQVDALREISTDAESRVAYYNIRVPEIEAQIARAVGDGSSDEELAQLNLDLTSTQDQRAEAVANKAKADADLDVLLPTLENTF